MSDRPNILLITTDQQRFDTIAALGNRHIHTPHLDWLADEGIAFTRAYADCPICMPARATIMTGKHGFNTGLVANTAAVLPMRTRPTMPGLLTRSGYQTRAQGKMHFHPPRANHGFEHMELPMDYYRERLRRPDEGLPKEHGVGENEITPVISTVDETRSLTHWTVRRSIDFLETRDETRPFFLWTSFAKPHPPWDPCANYWALYQNREVPPPVSGDWSASVEKTPQAFMEPTYALNNAWRMTAAQIADVRRAYYACITQIDYQLGLLFARMREMGLLENTWIIFTADHGEMLGDHHMAAKTVFLEGAARIPLLVRPPAAPGGRKTMAGRMVAALATLADLLPTVLGIAGVPAPPDLDGTDLIALAEKPAEREFHGVARHSPRSSFHCLMRGPHKYIWAETGGEELLFDLGQDPMEQHDLARDPAAAGLRAAMREALARRMAAYASPCLENGRLRAGPPLAGPREVNRWPGFHSTAVVSDVLH